MPSPTSRIVLPGNQFTVWTQALGPLEAEETCPAAPVKIRLPGNQFTVWTKPVGKPVVNPALISTPAKASDQGSGKCCGPWISRAALLALPVVLALWVWDHNSQTKQFRSLVEAKKAENLQKRKNFERARTLSHQLAEKTALLSDLETKSQTVGKERDGAKQALASTEQSLKTIETEAQSNATKLAAATRELAAIRKELSDKETALGNSVTTLKAEAGKLKQALEQKDLEMKDSLAKLDAEKATAVKDAAAAMAKVSELATQVEQLKKDVEAAKAAPKPQ